jgi:hypothetical protein
MNTTQTETKFRHNADPRFPGLAAIYDHYLRSGGTQEHIDIMSEQFGILFEDLYQGLSLNEGGKKSAPERYAGLSDRERSLSVNLGMIFSEKAGRMRNHLLHLEPGMMGQMAYTYYVGYDETPIPVLLPRGVNKGTLTKENDYRPALLQWIATANSDHAAGLSHFDVSELSHLGELICRSYALRIKQVFLETGITRPKAVARNSDLFTPGSFGSSAFVRYAWKNIADTLGQGSLYEPDTRETLV